MVLAAAVAAEKAAGFITNLFPVARPYLTKGIPEGLGVLRQKQRQAVVAEVLVRPVVPHRVVLLATAGPDCPIALQVPQ